jgi:hypothetical protein
MPLRQVVADAQGKAVEGGFRGRRVQSEPIAKELLGGWTRWNLHARNLQPPATGRFLTPLKSSEVGKRGHHRQAISEVQLMIQGMRASAPAGILEPNRQKCEVDGKRPDRLAVER